MKSILFALCLIPWAAGADITISEKMKYANQLFGGKVPHIAAEELVYIALDKCPNGYEKTREYITVIDGQPYLNFNIRCLPPTVSHVTPATP